MQRSLHSFTFFIKERSVLFKDLGGLGMHSFLKRMQCFAFFCIRMLCSFTFFENERCVLSDLLGSLKKNVTFFAFFYVLKKRTHRSFESHKSPKPKKKNVARFKRTQKNDAFRT